LPVITGFDHIVLAVGDVATTLTFYERTLAMTRVEHRPGSFALTFGTHKISLQPADDLPPIAARTTPGSGNFCVLTDEPIDTVAVRLAADGVEILDGLVEKVGATGPIRSIYFHDADGNLVEVANLVGPAPPVA
jgi:catechol 2,3-dioxygenase-like lactoylglutathione lyase family enzyme